MADPTKADLASGINERLRAVEATASEVKGALAASRFWLAIVLPLLTAIGGVLIGWVVSGLNDVRGSFVDLKTSHAVDAQKLADARSQIDRLERRIEDRFRPVAYAMTHYHEHVGKIAKIDAGSITFDEAIGEGKASFTFPVADGVRVLIKGESGRLVDLRPGMLVRILHTSRGPVQLIETVEDPPPAP